ncbi:FKBP-type peptidyl-prolyl cis-trans isomerase [Amnibacterium endophyticum]|uniref:peptidylprolyl isomerase n=1 Tax=Amnibacterium endophyticum TaxID=2109337 RepID=A0ABW4LI01_9MICO
MLRSRKTLSAVVALGTVLLTAGCTAAQSGGSSSSPSASTGATPSASATAVACAQPGAASKAVSVTDKGKSVEPAVSFKKGIDATATQRSVLTPGDGTTIEQGDRVQVAYTMYDGTSGKRIDSQGYGGGPAVFPIDGTLLPGIVQALSCTKVGERFAAVIPASQAFGDTGAEQIGVKAGDSLVFVGDVLGLQPSKATGTPKALPSGFPTVTLAADGRPTVKIPATDPPTTLKIAESKVGDGETVREGDQVTVQYEGVLWRNGKEFDSSWSRGAPATFATNQVVKGFGEALVGTKVGSQVVAIIPPADGYGKAGQGDIKGTDTMVFVIDVLATQRAS